MRRDRPSRSATVVARAVVLTAHDPRLADLLPDGLVSAQTRLLEAVGALKPWHLRLFRASWYRALARRMEALATPGHFLYLALRKRAVDEVVREAIARGAEQVLVVGGGMDTLCQRLAPAHPRVLFVEVDHPASQRLKARALQGVGPLPANVELVATDLVSGPPLDRVLAGSGRWRAGATSVVVAEGVLEYLPAAAVEALRDALARSLAPGSRWLLTYMLRRDDGSVEMGKRSRLMGWAMRLSGEPIVWAVRVGELAPFLDEGGFRTIEARFDLRARHLVPAGLPDEPLGGLELVALAERRRD